ncbi:hypothetical protein GCM10023222_26430 [Saccharopolyspora cebuensis]
MRVASAFGAALWAVVGVRYGWPLWVWLPLGVVTLIGPSVVLPFALLRLRTSKEVPIVPPEPVRPEPAPEPEQHAVTGIRLRSAEPDYSFLFSATVHWRPLPDAPGLPHAHPAGLAADVLLEQAGKIAATAVAGDTELARHRLAAALGVVRADPSGRVETWAVDVRLSLPTADADRLHRLAEVRKEQEVWERERDYERKKRAYLGEDVLKNPGSAVVWWLARNEDRMPEVVGSIDDLRKLTAAAHDTRPPEEPAARWSFINPAHLGDLRDADGAQQPTLFRAFQHEMSVEPGTNGGGDIEQQVFSFIEVTSPEDAERARLGGQVARVLEDNGQHELATKVRDRYGAESA